MLRKSAISAAAVVSSVALLVVGAPTVSQAHTTKELNMCWDNDLPNSAQDLEVVADGPSYKTTTLDGGECMAWDVRPGQYKLTVEDVTEFIDALGQGNAGFDPCDSDRDGSLADESTPYLNLNFIIKRMGKSYREFPVAAILNGSVTTNVKKDRRTTATVHAFCQKTDPGLI